jgi:hypothetical protein
MPPDTPKGKGKKLPKWAIPVGIVVVIGGVLYIRKRKAAGQSGTEPGSEGLTNQSFIPVTGESPASMGASGGGAGSPEGSIGGSNVSNIALLEMIKGERQTENERIKSEREFWEKTIANLGTGGGAPATGGSGGTVTAPPPEHASPTPAAPPPSRGGPKPMCPGPKGFPFQGPHGCYHISRTQHEGCQCHGYENGTLSCQHKVHGVCHW